MVNTNLIKHCVQLLANSDPQVYRALIKLCEEYTDELMVAVTEAPADEILRVQGRAQEARQFLRFLTEKPIQQPTP